MIRKNGKVTLLKDSKSLSYTFSLSKTNQIKFDTFSKNNTLVNTSNVLDKKVIDYSADIDKKDQIHLLCLTQEGNLVYNILLDDEWSSHILTKLDVKSNRYKHFILRVIKNNIHIFYGASNLMNSKLWSIIHIYDHNKKWNKNTVISMTPGNFPASYFVDFDKSGNIHLVFEDKNKGTQLIYYTYFNTFLRKWTKIPQQISNSKSNNNNPYLFVDIQNNVHVVWNASKDSYKKLVYKQMNSLSNSKFNWKTYKIPINDKNNSHPIIYQNNETLKILFNNNGTLDCLESNDLGYSWDKSVDFTHTIPFEKTNLINFATNLTYEKLKFKINHMYGSIDNKIELFCSVLYCNNNNHVIHYSTDKTPDSENENIDYIDDSHNPVLTATESILQMDLDSLKNNEIKDFIKSTRNSLVELSSRTNHLNIKTEEIEKVIFSNIKVLDKKIFNNDKVATKINENLNSIKDILDKYKAESDNIHQLMTSLESQYNENSKQIHKIESNLYKVHNLIEESSSSNILDKILNIFK